MNTRAVVGALLGFLVASVSSAQACEKYVEIPNPRIEELMAVLSDSSASDLKQLLSFEELACSEKPAVRKFAIDAGMASKNKTLRAQSLAALLMQRDQVRLEILEELKGDQAMENFLRQHGRHIAYPFASRNPAANCISISTAYQCPGEYMIMIDGLNVRMQDNFRSMSGSFTLQPDNSLRGTILVLRAGKSVAAKIDLDK